MELMKEMNERIDHLYLCHHDPMVSAYTARILHLLDGAIVKEEKP